LSLEEAERFRQAVNRKLGAEGIEVDNDNAAHKALIKCVMGMKLCEAYDAIYGGHNDTSSAS
jgi:hypothetical protein